MFGNMPPPALVVCFLISLFSYVNADTCDSFRTGIAHFRSTTVGYITFQTNSDCSVSVHGYLSGIDCSFSKKCDLYIAPYTSVDCSESFLNTLWDPTNSNSTYCTHTNQTACAMGDLSSKLDLSVRYTPFPISTTIDYNLFTSGPYSVFGRTVVLKNAEGIVACAPVLLNSTLGVIKASADISTQANLNIFQESGATQGEATLLFHVSSGSYTESDWAILDDCSGTTTFNPNPSSVNSNCSIDAQDSCAVGNLTGKLGQITATTANTVCFSDSNINIQPFDSDNSVVSRCLQVGSQKSDAFVIRNVCTGTPLVATATFSGDVTGTIEFSQVALGCPTTLTVKLSGLESTGNQYHIHRFPSSIPMETGGHFDPFGVEVTGYQCVQSNPKDCYIGDLSGKHGTISNTVDSTYQDYTLPLFGSNSIIFRPIVIHFTNGSRWTTAQILPKNEEIQVLQALFGPSYTSLAVLGNFTFMQIKDRPDTPTAIFIKARYNQGSSSYSGMWHVHEFGGDDDNLCQEAGGHFNPFHVKSSGCSPLVPEFCEVGDLAGKHGLLLLPSPLQEMAKYMYSDFQLPLTGSLSIKGKVLVIHSPDSGYLACARLFDPAEGYPTPTTIPPYPSRPPEEDDKSDGLKPGIIAAIVIGSVVGATGLAIGGVYLLDHHRSRRRRRSIPLR